jgi:hypothetical protein
MIHTKTRTFAADLLAKAGVLPPRDRPLYTYDQVFSQLKILDKWGQVVPLRLNAVQRHFAQHRTGRDVIVKGRQQGVSTYLQADQYTRSVTKTTRCATLAHDDATTQKLRRMSERFQKWLPGDMHIVRGIDNDVTTTYPQTNSEVTIATAGNAKGGRGGTYDYVHGSEVAHWNDPGEIMAGLMQGVPLNYGDIALESTANGAQGWFFNIVDAALNSDPDAPSVWTVHFYEWWWTEEYRIPLEPGEALVYEPEEQQLIDDHGLSPEQIKWRRAKIKEFKDSGEPEKFQQEYPEDIVKCFLTSGFSVFGNFYSSLYSAVGIEPQLNHVYVAGLDWGQASDYTCLSIIDVTANREVVLMRWRKMRWGAIRTEVINLCRKWHVSLLLPEKNSMTDNIEELFNEVEDAGLEMTIVPIDMSNSLKANMVIEFRQALENESDFKLLDIDFGKRELAAFSSYQNPSGVYVYRAPTRKGPDDEDQPHDDSVIARLLARRAMFMRDVGRVPDVLRGHRG